MRSARERSPALGNLLATRADSGVMVSMDAAYNALTQLLPGTEVQARGLRWEVVTSERLGPQTLYRLRGVEHAVRGHEFDLLSPFEPMSPCSTRCIPSGRRRSRTGSSTTRPFCSSKRSAPVLCWPCSPGGSAWSRTSSSPCYGRSA